MQAVLVFLLLIAAAIAFLVAAIWPWLKREPWTAASVASIGLLLACITWIIQAYQRVP